MRKSYIGPPYARSYVSICGGGGCTRSAGDHSRCWRSGASAGDGGSENDPSRNRSACAVQGVERPGLAAVDCADAGWHPGSHGSHWPCRSYECRAAGCADHRCFRAGGGEKGAAAARGDPARSAGKQRDAMRPGESKTGGSESLAQQRAERDQAGAERMGRREEAAAGAVEAPGAGTPGRCCPARRSACSAAGSSGA